MKVGYPVKVRSSVQGVYRTYRGEEGTVVEIENTTLYPIVVRFPDGTQGVFESRELREAS